MSDEDYRALLDRVAQVKSSTELDDAGFKAVMIEFERLGFSNAKVRKRAPAHGGRATNAQLSRIQTLWRDYAGEDDDLRLRRWLEKKFHVSHPSFLPAVLVGKVIAVMEKMAAGAREKRAAAQRQSEEGGGDAK